MTSRLFISSGHVFRVAHDEPDEPSTAGVYVGDLWTNFPDSPAVWTRELGLFKSEGEAITAAKRELGMFAKRARG